MLAVFTLPASVSLHFKAFEQSYVLEMTNLKKDRASDDTDQSSAASSTSVRLERNYWPVVSPALQKEGQPPSLLSPHQSL